MQVYCRSIVVIFIFIFVNTLYGEDFIRINHFKYSESNTQLQISTPSIEINKELGTDYTLNTKVISPSVSGGNSEADRTYGSVSLLKHFENRDELITTFSKSYSDDFDSSTVSLGYLKWADDSKKRSYNIELQYKYSDILTNNCSINKKCTLEESLVHSTSKTKKSSKFLKTKIGFTQVLDRKSLVEGSAFYTKEDGYLSNFDDKVVVEKKPDKRNSYGFDFKYTHKFSDVITSQFQYSFYKDNWGIRAHTFDFDNYYELNSKYIIGFGLRYYEQTKANFYNKKSSFKDTTEFSGEKYNKFNAVTYKTSLEYKYNDKISYNIGFHLYNQSTGLKATYTTIGFKYKF